MTVTELAPGLIESTVSDKHLDSLKEDLEETEEVLGLIHDEESEEVSVIISIAHIDPDLNYIQ